MVISTPWLALVTLASLVLLAERIRSSLTETQAPAGETAQSVADGTETSDGSSTGAV